MAWLLKSGLTVIAQPLRQVSNSHLLSTLWKPPQKVGLPSRSPAEPTGSQWRRTRRSREVSAGQPAKNYIRSVGAVAGKRGGHRAPASYRGLLGTACQGPLTLGTGRLPPQTCIALIILCELHLLLAGGTAGACASTGPAAREIWGDFPSSWRHRLSPEGHGGQSYKLLHTTVAFLLFSS